MLLHGLQPPSKTIDYNEVFDKITKEKYLGEEPFLIKLLKLNHKVIESIYFNNGEYLIKIKDIYKSPYFLPDDVTL